jgi:DNA-directed RNA polymerase specialized sigma24 family protein
VLAKCTEHALLAYAQPLLAENDQSAWVQQQWKILMQAIGQITIDRPPSSASRAKRVEAEEGIVRQLDHAVQQYEKAVPREAPAAEFCFLLRIAVDKLLYYLQRLRTSQTTLEAVFDTCGFEHYDRIFLAGLRIVGDAPIMQLTTAPRQEILQQAVEAMRQALYEGLVWQVGYAMNIPIPEVQDWAAVAFSGWMASKISLAHNSRLKESLTKELGMRGEYTQSLRSELFERLPANTYRAWREGEGKTLAKLRTRIAALVEHDVSEQSPQEFIPDVPLQVAPQPLDNPTYEAIARKLEEEDQYMGYLIKEADLSPLEADVTRLKLQDPPQEHLGDHFNEREIADMLDRSLGSVKQAWLRARSKLQRVINQ